MNGSNKYRDEYQQELDQAYRDFCEYKLRIERIAFSDDSLADDPKLDPHFVEYTLDRLQTSIRYWRQRLFRSDVRIPDSDENRDAKRHRRELLAIVASFNH